MNSGLIIKQFDGTYFLHWQFRIKLSLEIQKTLEVLKAEPELNFTNFKKKDARARNTIIT